MSTNLLNDFANQEQDRVKNPHKVVSIKLEQTNIAEFCRKLEEVLDKHRDEGYHLISSFKEYGYVFLIFLYY
jgi:hypothetical protein